MSEYKYVCVDVCVCMYVCIYVCTGIRISTKTVINSRLR